MSRDPELMHFREHIHCGLVLERVGEPWTLDKAESTRNALKYRRGKGETLIVNHDGKGWWDPHSDVKGDVISLVQYLKPGTNLGLVRKILRPLARVEFSSSLPSPERPAKVKDDNRPVSWRWNRRPELWPGSKGWRYLTEERGLPAAILNSAIRADVVRYGRVGSAWFAHRDERGTVCHIDVRGPDYKGGLTGGRKTLFRFGTTDIPRRLVLTEAAIDALSLAAMHGERDDTLYAATSGGMGPHTLTALKSLLTQMAERYSDPVLISAVDANPAGARYAGIHAILAAEAGVRFERLRPPIEGGDWNQVLQNRSRP
ncbi:DUF3991 and toprim domain-containing protein [Beijerinckia indica]|uniref:DUF3991 domain-containing protein n=1 Tax=Beijerinckia indica subsp. indica (strain ATCC 9039 / DSM 1715 / NCIMB 8712) TaxID=395963 RepID=B2IL98_BEII9|nr:DUF3991 and toprim domain-containing protein [Beijerinckia indica]ACB97298.1 conserved hypothetical protein [Beijerinckia indica subsp. indica ATCC 9039]